MTRRFQLPGPYRSPLVVALLLLVAQWGCAEPVVAPPSLVLDQGGDAAGGDVADLDAVADAADDATGTAADAQADAPADAGPAACQSDKQCAALGLVCAPDTGTCVACVGDEDCPAGQQCKAHQCLPPPAPCASSKDCPAGLVCDKPAEACVQCVTAADCAADQACAETVCVAQICAPGKSQCQASQLQQCKADGSGWTLADCPSGEACVGSGCVPVVCVPDQAFCAGDLAQTCDATGTAPVTVQDCAAAGKSCVGGQCVVVQCEAGATQCQGNAVATCTAAGTGWQVQACPDSTSCKAGACEPWTCLPGTEACDGAKVTTCDADGLGQTAGEDCGAKGLACVEGACAVPTCTAGTTQCDGATLQTCIAGTWWASPCDDGNACTGDGCADGKCTAVPMIDGTPCSDGNGCTTDGCSGGACQAVPIACGPNAACTEPGVCQCNAGFLGDGQTCLEQQCGTQTLAIAAKVDIVLWVDTSGSMSQEAAAINQNLGKLIGILAGKGIDYRLVVFGNGLGLCNSGCPVNDTAHFLWVKQYVGSKNGPSLISTQTHFNKFKAFLRPDAVHHVIGVSDDNSSLQPTTFITNYENLLKNQGLPESFVYHAIVSFANAANPEQYGNCPGGASYGSFHVQVAKATGGSTFQICLKDWTQLFEDLAQAIAPSAAAPCSHTVPVAAGKTFAPASLQVAIQTAAGTTPLLHVGDALGCGGAPTGWYYEPAAKPEAVHLCTDACAMLGGEAKLVFQFGCPAP